MSTTNVLRFCNEDNCIIVGPDCGAEIPTTILERLNGVVVTQKNGLVNPLNIKPSWAYGDAVLKVGDTVVDLDSVHGIFRRNGFVNTHSKWTYTSERVGVQKGTWQTVGTRKFYYAEFPVTDERKAYFNGGYIALLYSSSSVTGISGYITSDYYLGTTTTNVAGNVYVEVSFSSRPTTSVRYIHLFGVHYEVPTVSDYKRIDLHIEQYGNFKERNYDGAVWSTSCGTALSVLNNGTAVTSGYVPADSSYSVPIGYVDTIGGSSQDNTFGFMCPTDKCVVCDKIYKNGLRISETVLKHKGGYYG